MTPALLTHIYREFCKLLSPQCFVGLAEKPAGTQQFHSWGWCYFWVCLVLRVPLRKTNASSVLSGRGVGPLKTETPCDTHLLSRPFARLTRRNAEERRRRRPRGMASTTSPAWRPPGRPTPLCRRRCRRGQRNAESES